MKIRWWYHFRFLMPVVGGIVIGNMAVKYLIQWYLQ